MAMGRIQLLYRCMAYQFVGKISYFCNMNISEVPFIDIHTHGNLVDCGLYSFGIHPWRLCQDDTLSYLETLLKENKIVAIGECGIDRNHKQTIDLQLEVFERQILLSEQYQKPLVIHNVKATADILQLHKRHQPKQAWIIHGFNGTEQEAKQLTDNGLYLSVGESLFYPNRKIIRSISSIPLDQLFFETDVSERSIHEIYEKAAELLNLPLEMLKERIFTNFARLKLTTWKNGKTELGCSLETMALINCNGAMC